MFPVIWLKGREINLPKKKNNKKKPNSKTAKNSKRLNQYNQE